MSDQVSLFGYPVSLWQVGIFVSGIAVGATSVFVFGNQVPKTSPIVAPKPTDKGRNEKKLEEDAEEDEEEEEDEEWDSDYELLEEDEKDPDNVPHKMLLIVRTDLKMSHGKIAAQCGHATLGAYKTVRKTNPKALRFWMYHGQAKIAVKVPSEAEMDAVREAAKEAGIPTTIIADAGKTQIAAGSRTVLALGPAPATKIDAVAGHLKLY